MQKKTQLLRCVVPLLILLAAMVTTFGGNINTTEADSSQGSCQLTWNGSTTLNFGNVPSDVRTALSTAHLKNCTQPYSSCTLIQGSGTTALKFDNIKSSRPTLVQNLEHDNLSLNCQGGRNSRFNRNLLPNSNPGTQCNNAGSQLPNSDCNSNTPLPITGACQLSWQQGGGGIVTLDTSEVTDQGLEKTLEDYNLRCADDVNSSSCTLVSGANDSGDTILDLANVQNRSPWIYQQLVDKYGLNCDDI